MKLTLVEKKPEAGDAISFFFEPETPITWQAGQFLHYVLEHPNPDKRGKDRWFTIAAAPFEKRILITTRIPKENISSFKKNLSELPMGRTIEADGPEGDFIIADTKQTFVLIAGGIGITPYRSILLDLDRGGVNINALLLWANRTPEFVFKDELEALTKTHPNFKIKYFVHPEKIDEGAIWSAAPDLAKPVFYTSGPEPMVEAFEKMLAGIGIPDERSKRDYFPGYQWP